MNYDLYQIQGSFQGKIGVFEWVIDASGDMTHRRFIPGGQINGFPNYNPRTGKLE